MSQGIKETPYVNAPGTASGSENWFSTSLRPQCRSFSSTQFRFKILKFSLLYFVCRRQSLIIQQSQKDYVLWALEPPRSFVKVINSSRLWNKRKKLGLHGRSVQSSCPSSSSSLQTQVWGLSRHADSKPSLGSRGLAPQPSTLTLRGIRQGCVSL